MKESDKVICINNIDYIDENVLVSITIDKQYEVIETYYDDNYSCIKIIDDAGYRQRYLMKRFITVSDKRENILNELGI